MTIPVDDAALAGLRVLVVEDMLLVAEMIADLLTGLGVEVVGPVGRLAPALAAAGESRLDGALLDVNLGGESSWPVAAALRGRGIPFVFLTGYGDPDALPEDFRATPRLVKPFRQEDLIAAMAEQFRPACG